MDDIPVMLIHGFASSFERNWRGAGWVDLLRDEGRSVIGVDVLGHGQAAKPRDPAAYSALEQSVIAVLPAAGRVDAVGFSLGAELLLRAAVAVPSRFRRIVVGGVGDGVSPAPIPSLSPGPSRPGRLIGRQGLQPPHWPISRASKATTGSRWPPACAGRESR